LSAKWRRSRKSLERFNFLKEFKETKEKKTPRTFGIRKPKGRKKAYSNGDKFPKFHRKGEFAEPEPLIDVLEGKDEIVVIAELVGFSRESLRIHLRDQKLTLTARATDRKYHKSLNLPKRVIPDNIKTTYKNGVLEIQLKKTAEEKTIDKVAD